jgi:glycosyltransferase involved in cell wall biosynthesis
MSGVGQGDGELGRGDVGGVDVGSVDMNVLAYVHLRNIHHSTGAGRVARNLTEALSLQPRVNVRVLADRADHARLPADIGAPWSAFSYAFFDADTSRQQASWVLLRRPTAQHYWPEADITFCTGESFVPKGRSRLAVTTHDAAYFEASVHEAGLAAWQQRWKWKYLYSVLASQADMVHTVSAFSAERLGHFFPALRPRIRVVHNGVTASFFEPPPPETRAFLARHGIEGRRYIHVPGGLNFRKNAPLILAAWPLINRAAPDVLLAISGHVAPAYREAAARLGPSVRLLGFTSDDELKRVYRDAELTWFPSRYEGFGIPVLESMACGAPVISSNVSAIPEIAQGKAVLLPVDSVTAHRDAVVDLLADPARRAGMRADGRIHAAQFTWPRAARQLSQLFRELL